MRRLELEQFDGKKAGEAGEKIEGRKVKGEAWDWAEVKQREAQEGAGEWG